ELGELGPCLAPPALWQSVPTGSTSSALDSPRETWACPALPSSAPSGSALHLPRPPDQALVPSSQVRPKTLIPDSLPITPGRDRPPKQPPTFQKATVVSIKNPSPALPTANNTVSRVPTPSSQPQALAEPTAITSPLSGAGVAYAIISTSPSNATAITPSTAVPVASDSIKVQPLLISADSKVIILQPQVQTQPESSADPRPPSEKPSQGAQATKKKKEDRPTSQENPEVGVPAMGMRVWVRHWEDPAMGVHVWVRHWEDPAMGVHVWVRHWEDPAMGVHVWVQHWEDPAMGMHVWVQHWEDPAMGVHT
ncbi:PREDICTED: PHD finger protein 21B-like, partial [Dipodomys ordii]|uniref:PHD finger protein 21B-like n=1 Tax=Dipodomys ordii TaxID=10020 RepID=A0A1S3GXK9_DIPOR